MSIATVITNGTDAVTQGAAATDPLVLGVAFLGAILGIAFRTIYPYLERAREEEAAGRSPIHFLGKYKFTTGIAFLLAVVTTMGGFDQLTRNLDESAPLGTIFIIAFTSAIGWNELTNRVSYKIADKMVENKTATTPEKPLKETLTGTEPKP
jgi:hypothetical protein